MSIAAEELRNQLTQTKNAEVDESETSKSESKGINHFATFPWLYGLLRKCREAIGAKSASTLDGLLYALVKELSISIKDCYSRPNRAGKLRDIVCQMLVYFNMLYRDLKDDYVDNNNTYLHLMTELLAIYLDLEIKASKRGVHSLKKIGQFMTTTLYTHLGQSEDHMIEAILKAKLITKSAGELCAPVLSKVLTDGRCFVGDENAYVRFLLAFKLLHKITRRAERRDVTKMAMRKLDPAPELVGIVRRMSNIFPSQKIADEPITVFLMNAKFDFIKAKREFLRTGSISKGSTQPDVYPDKSFAYGNQSNSITNLLKQCRKDEQKSNCEAWSIDSSRSGSTDSDLDPSIYRISLDSKGKATSARNDDDVEFIGTRNRADKPVVLITLDSDDESHGNGSEKSANVEPMESRDEKFRKQKKKKKRDSIDADSYKKISANVPESDKNPDSGDKLDNSSTKHAGGVLPSILQSPEHGVIDSTNNFIDSDESFRSPMRKTYEARSNSGSDEKVSSSLDFVDSTAELFDEDYNKAKEPEITSTRDKSEPFGTRDVRALLGLYSRGKNWDADSPRGFSQSFPDGRSVITSGPLVHDGEQCSSTNSNNQRKCIIQNCQRTDEPPEVDSVLAGVPQQNCQPGVIQRTKDGKVNEVESNQSGTLDSSSLHQTPRYGKVAQCERVDRATKNFTGNLDKLIATPAKKVNFENVVKSYKIVKSNRLKASEPDGNRTPKFIKIEKGDLIGKSLKVNDGVKFVSKSLDFRTSKAAGGDVSTRGRDDIASRKGATNGKGVGSRTRTSQCVPIIFKKMDETRSQTKRRTQRGAGEGKSKRKHKSHASNVIKTDINMKSTLKHINPSSIPQFAGDVAKDRKRKFAVVEPSPPKVKCVGNYTSGDAPENRTVEIKLVIPDKLFGLKSSDSFQGHGNETSITPVMRPSTVQLPVNQERASFASVPHADSTQEGSFNQFPPIYPPEPSLYCNKPDYPHKIQNEPRFFAQDVPETKFDLQKPIPFEQGYQDMFPVLSCDEVKNPETGEGGKHDLSNEEEITDLVERQDGLNVSDDRRYDNHGRASSLEVGMAFSGAWNSGKVASNAPRDLVISEISDEELKHVDEELREFVEPWEGPRDCCPDDDEFFLSALPDPQKLFSEEDFSHLLDVTFPASDLHLESVRPEDFGDMDAFDEKCLCDLRGERDLDMLESTFNENFFVLQEKFPDCDASRTDGAWKKSPRLSSPESRSDDQPKQCFEKGRRGSSSSSSSSSGRSSSSSGSSSRRKDKADKGRSKSKPNTRSKIGVIVEGSTEKVDKKKLRSDSVAYHTRSISQKGIPIEYAFPPPKRVKNKKNRTS